MGLGYEDDGTKQRGLYTPVNQGRRDVGLGPATGSVQSAQTAFNIGQPKPPPAPVSPYGGPVPGNFQVPGYDEQIKRYQEYIDQGNQRVAPTVGGVTISPTQMANMPNLGPAMQAQMPTAVNTAGMTPAQVQAAQLGGVSRAADPGVQQAAPTQIAQVGAAQQAADSAFRAYQEQTLGQLGRWSSGEESLAGMQGQRMTEQALAQQMAMARSARPSGVAGAQRDAAFNQGRIQADMNQRILEAQLAERMAATQQLGNISGQARGQDLQLGMFNADQGNQNQRLQANLAQNAYGLDTQSATSTNIARGQIGAQVGIANAGFSNQNTLARAQLEQEANLANAANLQAANMFNSDLTSRQGMFNADLGSRTDMFNVGQGNEMNRFGADLGARVDMFNAGSQNQRSSQQANLDQNMGQFNAGLGLDYQRMNDARMANLLGLDQGMRGMQQHGALTYEQLRQQERLGMADNNTRLQIAQMQKDAAQSGQPSWWERALGAVGTIAPIAGMFMGGPAGAAIGTGISGLAGMASSSSGFGGSGGWDPAAANPYDPNAWAGGYQAGNQSLGNYWMGGG